MLGTARTSLAGLRAHRARLALTALAILLGVAFAAGSLVLTDSLQAALRGSFAADARRVDVVAVPRDRAEPLGGSALARVRHVAGVAVADGRVQGVVTLLDQSGRPLDGTGTVLVDTVAAHRTLRWQQVVRGDLPTALGQIALDATTAERLHLTPGDRVRLVGSGGDTRTFTMSGTVDTATAPQYAASPYAALTAASARDLTGAGGYARIDVRAVPGIGDETLRARVAAALGADAHAYTGEQYANVQMQEVLAPLEQIRLGLLAFAGIALLVAAIVIANTFAIVVAQRTREMALLRCVGATRRQVYGLLLGEAAVLGVVGSTAGALAGIGLGWVASVAVRAAGVPVPPGPLSVTAVGVGLPLLVGTFATVAAAALPARTATRIAPVAALRPQEPAAGRARPGVLSTVLACAALVLGGAGIVTALLMAGGNAAFLVALAAGAVTFLGVLLLTPVLVPAALRALGRLLRPLLGTPGRLAVANAVRNPGRTAATAAALLVGVTLISTMTVASASVEASATSSMDQQYPYDLAVTARTGEVPPAVVTALVEADVVDGQLAVRVASARVDGRRVAVQGVDVGDVRGMFGRTGAFQGVAPGAAVVPRLLADREHLAVGDRVTLRFGGGRNLDVRVAATAITDVVVVTAADLRAALPRAPVGAVYLQARDGASVDRVQAAVDRAVAGHPRLEVGGPLRYKASIEQSIRTAVLVFAGLLAVAVLIALVGIANTLALSVLERRRESAVLRALGLTRGRLAAMLSGEAVLIAAAAGVVGVLLGVGFGALAVRSLLGGALDARIAVPYGQLAAFVALAAAAGLLASLLPARRASRTPVVAALAA